MVPAIISGKKFFKDFIRLNFPTLPTVTQIKKPLDAILRSGEVTNGITVRELEGRLRDYLGVKYVLAVNSCTSGLMLTMKAMGLRGEVILPSFTFSASVHAIHWNGLQPVFADIEAKSYNLDPRLVEQAISKNTAAILGVHLYGNPCAVRELEKISSRARIPLIFDAAHACGSKIGDTFISNFGDAEVFSLSPTKCFTTLEGGIIATNDRKLYEKLFVLRRYGDPGTYNCIAPGLNARMSEVHALIGLFTHRQLEREIAYRYKYCAIFEKELADIPGWSMQTLYPKSRTTFKDFTLRIHPREFGLDRDQVAQCLKAENIDHRFYFHPPQHQQDAYPDLAKRYHKTLPVTEEISTSVISLPIYSSMPLTKVRAMARIVAELHHHAPEIRQKLKVGKGRR